MRCSRWLLPVLAGLALALVLPFVLAAAPARVSGLITALDLERDTLVVQDPVAGDLTLLVDEATVIVLDGDDQAILDDLFEGDEILSATVRELNSGRLYLVEAQVTSRPAPEDGE